MSQIWQVNTTLAEPKLKVAEATVLSNYFVILKTSCLGGQGFHIKSSQTMNLAFANGSGLAFSLCQCAEVNHQCPG